MTLVPSLLLILVIGGAYLSSSSARRPRLSARGKLETRERERMMREEGGPREMKRENEERERIMTCQPGGSQVGDGRIKNATSTGMLRRC